MKVLLRRNVKKLGQIGEVVEVKTGFARNYLLPKGLAVAPSDANLKHVEAEKKAYLEELARQKAQLEARARLLEGKEYSINARANEEGHLYGSVGPAQVAALVSKDVPIDTENVLLDDPLRKVDNYEITIEFAEGVTAKIHLKVLPIKELTDEEPPAAAGVEPARE